MKQRIIVLAGAVAVAGGLVIAAAATGQAAEADLGRPVSTPAPQATVASDQVAPLGEWGVGRRTPRA
ncbi:hypothetical protein [Streptomyces sp. cmx-4-9]|uniref:hypothetical protein n=1 Tax=Streptomyces sp. cmx-4-9 TaxID=2790941 RepID=UPI00397FAE3F